MTSRSPSFAAFAGTMTMISLCAVAAPASAERGTVTEPPALRLICRGGADDPVCRALSAALSRAGKAPTVAIAESLSPAQPAAGMTVRFVATLDRPDALSGHLAWETAEGASGAGPDLELSVMDAVRTPQMLERFAVDLVRLSRLPGG